MTKTEKKLTPYQQYQKDVKEIAQVIPYKPFRGARIQYNATKPSVKAADNARSWYGHGREHLYKGEAVEAKHQFKGVVEKAEFALAQHDMTVLLTDSVQKALEGAQEALKRLDAAMQKRDDADNAERAAKQERYPRDSKRANRFDSGAGIRARAADLIDFYGVLTPTITLATKLAALSDPLQKCADLARERQKNPQLTQLINKAAQECADGKAHAWLTLYEIERILEGGEE